MMAAAIALVILYVGLVVMPRAFGVNPASLSDWLAALAGVLSGLLIAPRPVARDTRVVSEAIASI
jgi:hypothetical protein